MVVQVSGFRIVERTQTFVSAADTMVHLRLSRADWEASGQAESIEISGFASSDLA
jgi:hypothetical protein